MRLWSILFLVIVGLVAGCDKPPAAAPASAPAPGPTNNAPPGLPTAAQPKLETTKLWLGPEEMITELARTGIQQQTGMMFRTNMAENEGMLFLFPVQHQTAFWMANTPLPLSAAYIDPDGVILEIHDLQPYDTNSVTAATDRVQFVLETRQGWFRRHNIKEGMLVRGERGTLMQIYRNQR